MEEAIAPITEEEKATDEEVRIDDSIMAERNATDKISRGIGTIRTDKMTVAEITTNTA